MDTQKILPRSEVPEELTWDLRDIFPSDEAWRAEYDALAAVPEEIAAFRGTLGRSAEDLLAWMRLQDALSIRLTKLPVWLRQLQGRRGHRQQLLSGHAQ